MALPLVFIGLAAASAATGIGKTVKAGIDNSKAKSINENAEERVKEASKELDKARKQCGEALDSLGREKVVVLNSSVRSFINFFEKIKNIDFSQSVGLDELSKFHIDNKSFVELKELESFATSLVGGSLAGVAGGALTAFGAYSAATTFATASTGTAIASLSGAAATNATLAFFGGGALTAGGLGMAGGTAVLGGLVAGPALLVMGMITGAKAGKNLEDAYSNAAKSREICEQLKTGREKCISIRRRTYMFYNLLARVDSYFMPLIYNMEKIIENEGTDYSKYSIESKRTIAAAATMAGTVKAILDTAILTESGDLTKESKRVLDEVLKDIEVKEKK